MIVDLINKTMLICSKCNKTNFVEIGKGKGEFNCKNCKTPLLEVFSIY